MDTDNILLSERRGEQSHTSDPGRRRDDPWYKSRLEFIERAQGNVPWTILRQTLLELNIALWGSAFIDLKVFNPFNTGVWEGRLLFTTARSTLLQYSSHFLLCGEALDELVLEASWWRWCCKDPAVVGDYDVLLTFADHKAEAFFTRHGFTDDPIIASRYRAIADVFQNSTLMCYITPFSGPGLSLDTLTALKQANLHMSKWREQAADTYWQQLTFMERLRHELLIVHGKCESQEEVIAELRIPASQGTR
eukprot:Em0011g1187a